MSYPRIIAALRSAKWSLLPSSMEAIYDALASHLTGRLAASPFARPLAYDDDEDGPPEPPPFEMIAPGVAAVSVVGIIGARLSSLETMCGGCDVLRVEANLAEALANPLVGKVILRIDSPGGSVGGVPEFARKIQALGKAAGKPICAFVEGMGCSAAYWIASACDFIACTPSSDVGSIGVYMALADVSEKWANEGRKLVLIKAGKYKADGIAGSQITEEQIARWKADVDEIYSDFTAFVSANRPQVVEETMQGQCFMGKKALAAGLVDRLCDDIECMVTEISGPLVV